MKTGLVKTGGSGDLHEHEGTVFVKYALEVVTSNPRTFKISYPKQYEHI